MLLIPFFFFSVWGMFSFTSCEKETLTPNPDPIFVVDDQGNSSFQLNPLRDSINALPLEALSPEETAAILYMREEEKLARDVYLTLYGKWNARIFDNISASEETHFEAVKTLIDRYSLADPSADKDVGEFTNLALQALHDSLLQVGNLSLIEALKVGAAIEEVH